MLTPGLWHLVCSSLNPVPLSPREVCVRIATCLLDVLHGRWRSAEAAVPSEDTDAVYPSHSLGIYLRLSAGQMTWPGWCLVWPHPGLAWGLGAWGGAGACPQTSGRSPGPKQIERMSARGLVARTGPAAGRAWRSVSSVVPGGTCVALCRHFPTLCSPLQAQHSGKGELRVTPTLPVSAAHSACPPPAPSQVPSCQPRQEAHAWSPTCFPGVRLQLESVWGSHLLAR